MNRWIQIVVACAFAFSFAEGAVHHVRSGEELKAMWPTVKPGDTVMMAAGEWRDLDLELAFAGTEDDPVSLVGAASGGTILSGATRLRLTGRHGVVRGLVFRGARAPEGVSALVAVGSREIAAVGIRLTDCRFLDCNPIDPGTRYMWIQLHGRGHRVDHSEFAGQRHSGVTIQIIVGEESPAHRIDHNLFRDRPPGTGNGFEIIQIGQSGDSMKRGDCVVEHNWFVRCDGETEIISSKTHRNRIAQNLFLESSGTVTLRHGKDSTVEDNYFIGGGKAGSGGVRVVDSGHRVARNHFTALPGRTGGIVVLYCGIPDSPLNGYFPAHEAVVASNVFGPSRGNGIYLNGGWGRNRRTLIPSGLSVVDNFWAGTIDGNVAIAGTNPGVAYEKNGYADGVELGLASTSGWTLLPKPPPEAASLWNADWPGNRGPATPWPDRSRVGPADGLYLPPLVMLEASRLVEVARAEDGPRRQWRMDVIAKAEEILAKARVYAVTANEKIPPSGNIHDYYSTGPYWWPNPETADGLPYVRRDGEFNPERDRVSDREPLLGMIEDTRVLALAYTFSGDERFAHWGHRLLHTWFLHPETAMTPHLKHAQAIPGRTDGRGTGIIDTHPFAQLVDAIRLLEVSPGFPAADRTALHGWFEQYLDWLLFSAHGRDEADSANNHGTAFDLQAAALMSFLGKMSQLSEYIDYAVRPRIAQQIEPDGAQPKELARTRSWSYATENLEHFFKLGLIARRVGVDLFTIEPTEGRGGLRAALDFVLPAVADRDAWSYRQATAWQENFIQTVLSIADGIWPEAGLAEYQAQLEVDEGALEAYIVKPAGDADGLRK